jgi:hypothetical protein
MTVNLQYGKRQVSFQRNLRTLIRGIQVMICMIPILPVTRFHMIIIWLCPVTKVSIWKDSFRYFKERRENRAETVGGRERDI